MVPFKLDGKTAGHILLFSKDTEHPIISCLRLPVVLKQSGSTLIAALIPWAMSPEQLNGVLPSYQSSISPEAAIETFNQRELTRLTILQHGLRILQWPTWLDSHLREGVRSYHIWSVGCPEDKHPNRDFETTILRKVLQHYGMAREEKPAPGENAKLIFVHIASVKTLALLPVLLERRMTLGCVFVLYGTHPSITPDRWGIREVYPIGMPCIRQE